MNFRNKPFSGYDSGIDFWRDTALSHGIDGAVVICNSYLDMNLRNEHSEDERRFCREMFAAMYEATANRIVPTNLVYPYDFQTANERMETTYFSKNRDMNQECARTIDEAISASNYTTYHYNLELATMSAIGGHGFERVNTVLAHQIQKHEYDGRYSRANKEWARNFIIPDNTHGFMDSHATLIEDFTTYVRKLYEELGADRFALPGNEEHGESEPVQGYGIIRSIMVNANQGYVIAHNPDAVDPFVCWQFTLDNGERSYNWGIYGDEQTAIDGYNARLFVAFN
jgi:hypothetical protein